MPAPKDIMKTNDAGSHVCFKKFFYKNVILINPVKVDFVVMQQRNLNRFK